MKPFFLCLCAVLIFNFKGQAQGFSGIPYNDASLLLKDLAQFDNNPESTNNAEIISIVAYYFDQQISTVSEAIDLIKTNNFLKQYSPNLSDPTVTHELSQERTKGVTPSSPTGVSNALLGMDVTNIADGIAKFLIKRGEQELTMAFFDRFRTELAKFPELTYLFPNSNNIIQNIESYNINNLLQELKDAFSKDLLNMPTNILSLKNIQKLKCADNDKSCQGINSRIDFIQNVFKSSKPDSRFLILPLITMQGIIDGNNIIQIADKLCADESVCGKGNDNLAGLIQLTSILLESFRALDDNSVFLNENQLKNLFYSKNLLNVFLGLVYQKYYKEDCYKNLSVGGKNLDSIFTLIQKSGIKFYSVLTSFDKINSAYSAIKSQSKQQKPDFSYYATIVSSSINMLANSMNAVSLFIANSKPDGFETFVANLNIANDVCNDIQQKNYAGIFNSCIKLISVNNIIKDDDTKEKLINYLSFAANLASAKTSDEVENAIEAVALPPGSFSIKQKSSINVSFNGYIGYAWDFNGGLYANGVYAPVGFSLNFGLGKKNGGALSIFASLIDVGGIASYRLSKGMTDTLKQQVRLESIISPSAQLIFEIPKWPIAICGGWRMTPKLFYSNNTISTAVKSTSAFNLSVLVDIPIFTIYNKPFK